MAVACPVDLDTGRVRHEIQVIYARVATDPSSEFHFHRGPAYAAERLGYDATALAALPAEATASFAGVANPLRTAALSSGAMVVDIGCGAGRARNRAGRHWLPIRSHHRVLRSVRRHLERAPRAQVWRQRRQRARAEIVGAMQSSAGTMRLGLRANAPQFILLDMLVLPAHASEPIPFDGQPVAAALNDVSTWLSGWIASESAFVERVTSKLPPTPANFVRIVELNEMGEFPSGDPTELEAGANRCAVR